MSKVQSEAKIVAKTKTPFYSFGSRGTVGRVLTSQKRGGDTILRTTPVPTDPYSLNQAYQRWDYKDYAYQWTLLSNAEKQVYRTTGSRYHITGFSQFMREKLKILPDLVGRWRLDEKSGAIARDSSKNAYHGTIIGASPTIGLIDGGFLFDGLNDFINFGYCPLIASLTDCTIELFSIVHTASVDGRFFEIGTSALNRFALYLSVGIVRIYCDILNHGHAISSGFTPTIGLPFHVLLRLGSTGMDILINGDLAVHDADTHTLSQLADSPSLFMSRSSLGGIQWLHSTNDHFTFYNRHLDDTEAKRHSERRYPA